METVKKNIRSNNFTKNANSAANDEDVSSNNWRQLKTEIYSTEATYFFGVNCPNRWVDSRGAILPILTVSKSFKNGLSKRNLSNFNLKFTVN